MKKFFIGLMILSLTSFFVFAEENDDNTRLKTADEILKVFDEPEVKMEEDEEFNYPVEKIDVKNIIKVDIGTPLCMSLFTVYNLLPTEKIRIPLFYEYAFHPYVSAQLEAEAITSFIMPSAGGVSAGICVYPLGNAPNDLYISVRGGGAFGMFYAYSVQASIGWQFILKNSFVISLGGEFAYYFETTGKQFYMPSVGISLGWGF